MTAEPDKAARFYSRVFGWRIDRANGLAYRLVAGVAPGIAGGIWPAPDAAASFVQLFIGVADVAEAVARAVEQGGTIVVPVSALPDGDVMAIVRDPVGVTFGLMQHPRPAPSG